MSLDKISEQLSGIESKVPPVELWDPAYCGEMDLVIKSDGSWWYMGTGFKRMRLVKLFASVLKKEDNEYFLVTPVEKIKITVEDVPFVLTEWQQDETTGSLLVGTNLGDEFIMGDKHPVTLRDDGTLLVTVRRNLQAVVHRNVFYQWIELANEQTSLQGTELIVSSGDYQFSLGAIE